MSSGATPPRRFAVLHSSPASETELFAQLSAEHHQADGSDHAGSHATATLGHSPAVNRLPDQPAPPPIIAESDPYPRATLSAMLEMEEQGFRTPPVGSPLVAAMDVPLYQGRPAISPLVGPAVSPPARPVGIPAGTPHPSPLFFPRGPPPGGVPALSGAAATIATPLLGAQTWATDDDGDDDAVLGLPRVLGVPVALAETPLQDNCCDLLCHQCAPAPLPARLRRSPSATRA
jgi:hypothetical protein